MEDTAAANRGPASAASVEELRETLYRLAHDLKGPCRRQSALIGMVLEDHGDGLDAEVRQLLERVQAQARQMSAVVDEHLEWMHPGARS